MTELTMADILGSEDYAILRKLPKDELILKYLNLKIRYDSMKSSSSWDRFPESMGK